MAICRWEMNETNRVAIIIIMIMIIEQIRIIMSRKVVNRTLRCVTDNLRSDVNRHFSMQ